MVFIFNIVDDYKTKEWQIMIYLAWALVNIANVTVFGYLAYHFNHWWIVLFSILLSSQIKTKKNYDNKE